MNNNSKHALWLPENSIQAILAIMMTAGSIAAMFKQVPMEYVALLSSGASAAWGFYFGKRAGESHPQE